MITRMLMCRNKQVKGNIMEAIAAISFYFGVVGLIGAGLYRLDMWMDTDKAAHTDARHRA